ncbi:MAG: hypothetical protein IPO06_11150 [Leptospiraceae bacterium]|nr:hypothetical protein [Leptospiraceae bacterium]
MSKQELLEKTSFYLEKLTDDKLEEIFHYVEFMYFKFMESKRDGDKPTVSGGGYLLGREISFLKKKKKKKKKK